ncbi:MAG: sigma-70 family RNA polymerase sigma factor [Pseudomonadota bacterium]
MLPDEAVLKSLMTAGLAGHAEPYRQLLNQLSGHLRGYFKNRLSRAGRSEAETEDLLQETLLAIHTRRHTYDAAELFTPWVYAIARYKLIDHLRHTRTSIANVSLDEAGDLMSEMDDQKDAESAMDIERLLTRLSPKTRCAIRHVKLQGSSVVEAARICGMSESAVKVSIHRGLRTLALLMAKEKAS